MMVIYLMNLVRFMKGMGIRMRFMMMDWRGRVRVVMKMIMMVNRMRWVRVWWRMWVMNLMRSRVHYRVTRMVMRRSRLRFMRQRMGFRLRVWLWMGVVNAFMMLMMVVEYTLRMFMVFMRNRTLLNFSGFYVVMRFNLIIMNMVNNLSSFRVDRR